MQKSGLSKLALMLGGYTAAFLIASAVVNAWHVRSAGSNASDGMAAGGELVLFIGVFGLLSLIPTGLACYFLLRGFLTR